LSQTLEKPRNLKIYDYDYQLEHVYNLLRQELSPENVRLIEQYDMALVNSALAKATRHKHLKMILSLSRLLNKNWIDVSKEDMPAYMEDLRNDHAKVTSFRSVDSEKKKRNEKD